MGRILKTAVALLGVLLLAGPALGRHAEPPASASAGAGLPAFPDAQGWAALTPGGRGGRIIRVTTLAGDGPGSFREAVSAKGRRIVVFEVGGVIDLERRTIKVTEPYLTIAGQTAPSPGVTFIKGGFDIATHDVIVQHLRIRPGEAGQPKKSGWNEDGISTVAARDVIVDHCTLTWATDENLSASGPRFTGKTPDDWRRGTSHRITFSNNIIGEGLARSTHDKLEHSKGSLIHDNVSDLLIVGNLYAHNYERNPHFKGGVRGVLVNNLIYDPGPRAVHYNLQGEEWGRQPFQTGRMTAVGNVLRAGPSTPDPIAFLMIGGDGDLDFHGRDNLAVDRIGRPLPMLGRYTTSRARIVERDAPLDWPKGLQAIPAAEVERHVLGQAGARPWDRDRDDIRLIADVAEGRGEIIDSEQQIHGYPVQKPTRRAFDPADWDLRFMTPRRPEVLDSGASARGT